ncbi:MAG: hypothetical protein H0W90_15275 [Actinobacteria bacterium]|nr:hypothetical protein [Actinomycetota bacterium]
MFVASFIHHLSTLVHDVIAPESPFRAVPLIRRWPVAGVAASAGLDAALVTVLAIVPVAGLAVASALLVAFALFLLARPPDAPCGCFGSRLESTNRGAAVRNCLLAIATAGGAARAGISGVSFSAASVGVALVIIGPIFALGALQRMRTA